MNISDTVLPDAVLPDAFNRSKQVTRRSMLGMLGLGTAGALGAFNFGGSPATAAPVLPGLKPPRPGPKQLQNPYSNLSQPGPYLMQASCDLSEEYFATTEITVNTAGGDRVMPFVNPFNGAVEAIIFTAPDNTGPWPTPGSVHHVQRNPAYQSGWFYATPELGANVQRVATDATIIVVPGIDSLPDNVYLMVMGPPTQGGGVQLWLTWLTSATEWDAGGHPGTGRNFEGQTGTWGPIKAGVDFGASNGYTLFFYQSLVNGSGGSQIICYVDTDEWTTAGTVDTRTLWWYGEGVGVEVDDYFMQYDPVGTDGWLLILSNETLWAIKEQEPMAYGIQFNIDLLPINPENVSDLAWAWDGPVASRTGRPALAYQTIDPDSQATSTWFVDEHGTADTISENAALASHNAVAVWNLDGLYTVNLLDPQGNLSTIAQYNSGSGPVWGGPVPIGKGLVSVFGVPTDQNEATLFGVDDAGVLNVFTKDPTTGWSQNVVHQPAASNVEVVSWRTQLTVWDTNQTGVAGASVQLSTDRPVGLWLAGTSAVLLPGSPATFTCDGGGQLTVMTPAIGLDTAQLTAQALDGNGNPSGTPLLISPDGDVHAYLAGTSTLASTGGQTLSSTTGSALTDAQSSTWNPTTHSYTTTAALPKLTTAAAGTANDIAAALNHTMSLPTNTPSGSDPQAGLLDFTGPTPTFQTNTNPHAFDEHLGTEHHWWDTVVNDIDSVFQALRHGLINLTKMITTWAKEWTINLVVDLGDGIEHAMNWVVTDVKDAIHAISGFFQTLGADLETAWNWLKNLVLGVIHDAESNAITMGDWCQQATMGTAMNDQLASLQAVGDGFFQAQESKVQGWFDNLTGAAGGQQVGQAAPQPQPTTGSSGDDSGSSMSLGGDFSKLMQHSPANWLMNKIKAHLPSVSAKNINVSLSVLDTPLTILLGAVQEAGSTAEDAATELAGAVKAIATSSGSLGGTAFSDMMNAFGQILVDVLKLLDTLYDSVIQFATAFFSELENLLTSEFDPIPVLGDLLELVGIDVTVSLQHITCLLVSFPATIIHDIRHGEGTLFPGTGSTARRRHLRGTSTDPLGYGLGLCAATAQFIWAFDDDIMDLDTLAGIGVEPPPGSSDLVWVLDFMLPLVMLPLQLPVPPNATTGAPFSQMNYLDSSWGTHNDYLPAIVATDCIPWVFEGLGWVYQRVNGATEGTGIYMDKVLPIVQSVAGAVNTVLGAMYAYSNAADAADKTQAVFDNVVPNLSYVDMFLEIFNTVPMMQLKIVIDTVSNFGAGIMYFIEAVALDG